MYPPARIDLILLERARGAANDPFMNRRWLVSGPTCTHLCARPSGRRSTLSHPAVHIALARPPTIDRKNFNPAERDLIAARFRRWSQGALLRSRRTHSSKEGKVL